jgi:hypothetical protein
MLGRDELDVEGDEPDGEEMRAQMGRKGELRRGGKESSDVEGSLIQME